MITSSPVRSKVFVRWICSKSVMFALIWAGGLFLGGMAVPAAGDPLYAAVLPQLSHRVTVVSLLITTSFPLLLAAYMISIGRNRAVFLISFCKAFQFSFCSSLICAMYGSAGWLVRFFLQFADILSVPVFCWFCIRQLSGDGNLNKKDLHISVVLTLLSAGVDYFAIAPFLAKLLNI